jgi:hypothetical protein
MSLQKPTASRREKAKKSEWPSDVLVHLSLSLE